MIKEVTTMKFLGTKILETERLILRKVKDDDYITAFYEWSNDPSQVLYTIHGVHNSIEDTKELFDKWIKQSNEDKTFRWMITLKDTNEFIGVINAESSFAKYDTEDIGYTIGKKYWNKGYASEALKAVIKYLFEECEVETICAEHMEDNVASGKVMQKSGMKLDGVLRKRCVARTGKRQNIMCYSILKDEYFNG